MSSDHRIPSDSGTLKCDILNPNLFSEFPKLFLEWAVLNRALFGCELVKLPSTDNGVHNHMSSEG
uniref:Uncharacterized protein n=1 Tax=Salix viminalis TaxID=40686 RepID=A0A6N2L714_SALVM